MGRTFKSEADRQAYWARWNALQAREDRINSKVATRNTIEASKSLSGAQGAAESSVHPSHAPAAAPHPTLFDIEPTKPAAKYTTFDH